MSSENSLKTEAENQSENTAGNNIESAANAFVKTKQADGQLSQFTLEECLRYVEKCRADGDAIQNARALATHLYQTGKADAFILATLYPVKQEEIDRERFGAPVKFSDEPCRVCFGARMADPDGKGFRHCAHCKNERGKSTGLEPEGGENVEE